MSIVYFDAGGSWNCTSSSAIQTASKTKDPSDVTFYTADFSELLDADTITTINSVTGANITIDSSNIPTDNQTIQVWVSGGTAGTATVKINFTTDDSQTYERSFYITVVQK